MIIGKSTLTGTPTSASSTSNKLLYGTGQEAVLSANQKLTGAYIGWGGKSVNPTGTPTGEVGLFDVSGSNYTTAPKIFSVAYSFSNTPLSGTQWIYIALDVDVSAHAGKTLAPAFAAPSVGNAFDVLIETVSGASRKQGAAGTPTTLSATLASGSVISNQAWAIYFETADISPAESIDTINGSSFGSVKAGANGNTVTVTGFVPTSGTHGGKAISALSGSAGSYTFTSAAYVDGATFPQPDTSQTFTLTDGSVSPTASSVYSSPNNMTSVILASPNTTDDTYVTYYIPTASNGDRIVYPTESGDFAVAADGKVTCVAAGVRVLWHWNSADSIMTLLNVTVNDAGDVVAGLTSSGLTSSGLTSAGLTSSGL